MGCICAACTLDDRGLCPFCRAPNPTSDVEHVERIKKRVEGGDAVAMYNLGCYYNHGECGLPQHLYNAMELWEQAGELGLSEAYHNVGVAYTSWQFVERDMEKAKYYFELAAMGGDAKSRHNLGVFERNASNTSRAVKHWMISAGAGDDKSLSEIRDCFMNGHATKDDFEKALRVHKDAKDEMRSAHREAYLSTILSSNH